ncbi:MAG: hypothetical protein HY680_07615 [Chloroflexi bacterium]|nr:hypothetical protein [Chloroflexota bacterium]
MKLLPAPLDELLVVPLLEGPPHLVGLDVPRRREERLEETLAFLEPGDLAQRV